MKYLAHLENNINSKIISIYDVIIGLNGNTPEKWEGRTYFSLWYNTPMIAKTNSNKQRPHFAFKKGSGGNEKSGGGESIEHQLSKKIISELKSLYIQIGEIKDILNFSEVIIEKPFDNRNYIADLYCKISNDNNFNFPINSMIVIELNLSSKVKKSKENFYRNQNITAIELKIWDNIKYDGNIVKLQNRLIGYFQKNNFAKRLHDPNWQEIKLKKEQQNKASKSIKFQNKPKEIEYDEIKIENILDKDSLTDQSQIKNIDYPISISECKEQKVSLWKKILYYFKNKNR